jgi:hypothetical protein
MGTYKNPFDPREDAMLWELHEIRHELHAVLSQKTVDEINADALKKYQQWQTAARDTDTDTGAPFALSTERAVHA